MNIKTSILLLAGCVFYLESLKTDIPQNLVFLLGSYIFIPAALLTLCQGWFKHIELAKAKVES